MHHSKNVGNRGAFNPFAPGGTPSPSHHQELTNEAIVVDVITNETHPEYAQDGFNVGAIKFRSAKSDMYRDEAQLNWALPLEVNISAYPLLNETVMIHSLFNRFYYTRTLNTHVSPSANPFYGLNEEMSPSVSQTQRSAQYRTHTAERPDTDQSNQKLGNYFVTPSSVYKVRHDEGDIVFQGRSGQSIKFGAAWRSGTAFRSISADQAPNIILRVGPDTTQRPTSKFGTVQEEINKDVSSIYITTDQVVPLEYATQNSPAHRKSIHDMPSRLDGAQIVMNTGRFVFNAKTDKIMGFALLGVHFNSHKAVTFDAAGNIEETTQNDKLIDVKKDFKSNIGRDLLFTVGKISQIDSGDRISLVSKKVYVGPENDESQPIVCGEYLSKFLEAFLDVFISEAPKIILMTGKEKLPSPLSPAVIAKLNQLKSDVAKGALASFNSETAYTKK